MRFEYFQNMLCGFEGKSWTENSASFSEFWVFIKILIRIFSNFQSLRHHALKLIFEKEEQI